MKVKESWEIKWCDYYKLLGISYDSDIKKIKSTYRKLVQEFHPDVHPGFEEVYPKKIVEINVAYEILSNPVKREKYDLEYKKRLNTTTNTNNEINNQKKEEKKSTTSPNFNNYSNEEMEATRKKAIKEAFAMEKKNSFQIDEKVSEAIDNLVLKAYSDILNEELYKKNYEILINLLKVHVNKFKVLHKEAQKLSMQLELEELEQIIAKIQSQISEIPKNIVEAKQFVEKQLKIEEIRKFCISEQEQVELLKQEFNNMLIMVFENKINDAITYQKKLELLLIKAKNHTEKIDKYKSDACEYNEFDAIQYLQQYKLIINNLVQSTPFDFEELKKNNVFLKYINERIDNINIKINNSEDSNEKIKLYSARIELRGEKAKLEYIINNRTRATIQIQKDIVRICAEIAYYEEKKRAISEEQKRLKNISFWVSTAEEDKKVEEYELEQDDLTKMLKISEKKYASLLNKQTQEEYINSRKQPKTEEERRRNEVNGELEGLKKEQEELEKKLEEKDYRQVLLQIESERIELRGEKAKLEYVINNRTRVTTQIQQDVVRTFAEIAYYEEKKRAISEEQERLEGISSWSLTEEECRKVEEYELEQDDLTKMLKISEKKYASLLNKQTQEEYINSRKQPKTEEERRRNEVNGELEGLKKEQEELEKKLEEKDYRQVLLQIVSKRIELRGEKAKQEYVINNRTRATTQIQQDVVRAFAEIAYYEEKKRAISEEQKRLKDISSWSLTAEECRKVEEYELEQTMYQIAIKNKKDYIEIMKEQANLQFAQNINYYNNTENFENKKM